MRPETRDGAGKVRLEHALACAGIDYHNALGYLDPVETPVGEVAGA